MDRTTKDNQVICASRLFEFSAISPQSCLTVVILFDGIDSDTLEDSPQRKEIKVNKGHT